MTGCLLTEPWRDNPYKSPVKAIDLDDRGISSLLSPLVDTYTAKTHEKQSPGACSQRTFSWMKLAIPPMNIFLGVMKRPPDLS